jgi:very-short-patch-repair endonuclease
MKYSNEKTLYHGAGGKLFEFGRDLRQRSTEAEKVLWGYLRNRKFYGLKFRRQHPIDEFVADFYCHEKKLIIELDGSIHEIEQNAQYDKARTNDLSELGIHVFRFTNSEVIHKISFVLDELKKFLQID